MDIDKADRTTLRSFFRKNLVPTEDNFVQLINGMLNQKDDGIARLPGDPLSIAAAGDPASPQKLIHFYGSFGDANPAWLLQMNPRADPNRPDTAKQGLSISDGQGTSRLFIDRATGNVGIGTISPAGRLDVNGLLRVTGSVHVVERLGLGTMTPAARLDIVADSMTGAGWLEAIRLSRPEHSAITFPAGGLLFGMHGDRRFYFADTVGGRYNLLVVSARDARVGINVSPPMHTLDVRGTSIKLGIEAGGGGQLIITSGLNDSKVRLEALNKDGNGHAAELLITGRSSGNVPLLTLGADQTVARGQLQVSTSEPVKVWNDWYEAIKLTSSVQAAITFPAGGLLFGMHSDRRFYFADTQEGQYLMTLDANPPAGGHVGIGTTQPTHKLHVVSQNDLALFESSSADASLRLVTKEGNDNRVEICNRTGARLALWTAGGGDVLNVTRDGKVGIGTTSPQHTLDVRGTMLLQGSRVYPKVKVFRDQVVTNSQVGQAGSVEVRYAGEFTEVYECFAMLQGLSLTPSFKPGQHWADVGSIPQVVSLNVTTYDRDQAVVAGYCSESTKSNEKDNSVMFTLVVIGC